MIGSSNSALPRLIIVVVSNTSSLSAARVLPQDARVVNGNTEQYWCWDGTDDTEGDTLQSKSQPSILFVDTSVK